ncbi:glycosyltransferase [Marinobacter sp. R17]|uniref:glycosyltransferase family 2 protein n=1 Tax=Marinobacter sp. R17 TaxID=2484250 RepID=UPI000F4CC428|nr:glycosyltransferase family 2 protein [Marinobacter sp. R17]ROT98394.1 glycosyltransferase [Marinobacter sp. R17]
MTDSEVTSAMELPLVTVIIPAFNAEDYLDETLSSIEAQTYPNIEIIVVDDGSTDSTPEIVNGHTSRVRYIRQDNSGSCSAPRNLGLRHAAGEFITFFDADDIMLPHKVEHQVEQFFSYPEAVFVTSNYRNFTENEKSADHFSSCPLIAEKCLEIGPGPFLLPSQSCRNILLEENFTIASSPLFRRSLVFNEGGFDESLRACEDFHLIYRIAMKGPVVVLPEVAFERRLHDLNMSGDPERMMSNFLLSRMDLIHQETEQIFRKKLKKLVRHMKRELQTQLIRKGKLKAAVSLYGQTFPPCSRKEIKHDVFQGTKIVLTALKFRDVEQPESVQN